jgi:hypothetical protein
MIDTRTSAILQRMPVVLAVTANSYGLTLQACGSRKAAAAGERNRNTRSKTGDKPAAHR